MQDFPADSPFGNNAFHISSHEPLKSLTNRYICNGCQKSSRYFCYRCVRPAEELEGRLPNVELPLELVILKHARELEGKTTAVHAALLAPTSTRLIPYDPTLGGILTETVEEQETLLDADSTVILFPEEGVSQPISAIDWNPIKRIIVIDGTWQQAKGMLIHDEKLRLVTKRVHLDYAHEGLFWRHQPFGKHCLSTIEAIYYFYREYCDALNLKLATNLDDLLYFFSFFYHLIQEDYQKNPNRKFNSKHRADYIKR